MAPHKDVLVAQRDKNRSGVVNMSSHDNSKRQFIKTLTYAAPAILTLKVAPSYASTGSGRGPKQDQDRPGNRPPRPDGGFGNGGRGRRGGDSFG